MGLFLNLSGVIGASTDEVTKALAAIAAANGWDFALVQGTTDDPNIGVMAQQGSNTSVVFPDDFLDGFDVSQELSGRLQKPVFSFHIHDGDLWLYVLYHNGCYVDQFNPIPEYWKTLSQEEKKNCAGDARLISKLVPGVHPASIEKYLVEWDINLDNQDKAYPDDEYPIDDCWQMCDFMKKLGLPFPLGPDGDPLGPTYRLVIGRSK